MFINIIAYTIGGIIAIPILLWYAIRRIFTGSLKLLGFVCQRQYRELKRLCERGTAAELQAFLTAHPGAKEYIVYTRKATSASVITSLFKLPSPLAVAGQANNLAVIPVLLAIGASPEVRSVSAELSPAEEAIGAPDKMRALCSGKTWWMEHTAKTNALEASIKENNARGIVWNVMRGAKLESPELFCKPYFLRQPFVMQSFIFQFVLGEKQRREYYAKLMAIAQEEMKKIPARRFQAYASGRRNCTYQTKFNNMLQIMELSLHPLPDVDDDTMERLMFSAKLLDRAKMLELVDTLFNLSQIFALLDKYTHVPITKDNREMLEETVDVLLCSILKNA